MGVRGSGGSDLRWILGCPPRGDALEAPHRRMIVRCHFDQVLRGDAANIDAGAPDRACLDDGDLAAHPNGLNGRRDARAAGANNDEIKISDADGWWCGRR